MKRKISLVTLAILVVLTPSSFAAVKPAGIARVGDQCLRNGVVAAGRGINGTDLVCMPANLGSAKGDLLWWYPNLKQQNIFELIAPIVSRSSDAPEVIASRSADRIGKIVGQGLKGEELIKDYSAKNFTGGYGQLALSTFQSYRNRTATSFIGNLNLLSGLTLTKSNINLLDSKPIANLIVEYEAIAVPSNSRYSSITQLVNDLTANPKAVTFLGGPENSAEYYFFTKFLKSQNIDFRNVSYQSTTSGAQLLSKLSGDSSKVAISVNGHFVPGVASGKVRILGLASPDRLPWIKGKTLTSQGIPIIFGNWYGVFAPGNLGPSDSDNLLRSLEILHNSKTWIKTLADNYWNDGFQYSSDFGDLIKGQISELQSFAS